MRRIGICKERGSGFDKIVHQTELYELPVPEIEIYDNHTKVTLLAHKSYGDMTRAERLLATYMHACLKKVNRDYATNSSLRERFKLDTKSTPNISRLLNDACKEKIIKLADESEGLKNRRYVPFWA